MRLIVAYLKNFPVKNENIVPMDANKVRHGGAFFVAVSLSLQNRACWQLQEGNHETENQHYHAWCG